MIQLLIALPILSLCCFVRAWSLKQWPFRRRRHEVRIDFEEEREESWDGTVVTTAYAPGFWITRLPFDEIYRHLPKIGDKFGEATVRSITITPI